jgi:hypothetical protein
MPDQNLTVVDSQPLPTPELSVVKSEPTADQLKAAHSDFQGMISDFRDKHPVASQFVLGIPDAIQGIGAGVVGTGVGAYDLARKIPGASSILPEPSADLRAATVAPPSVGGWLGKALEQGAEFMIPGAIEGDALRSIPAIGRIAAEAANAGGVAALQSGGDPTAMGLAAATGGVLGGIGEGAQALVNKGITPALTAAPRPLSQDAIALAQREGIPLNQGALGGSRAVQSAERLLGNTVAPDQYEALTAAQQKGQNAFADKMASGMSVSPYQAGQGTLDKIIKYGADRTSLGRQAYSDLEAIQNDPANLRSVPTGTQPSRLFGPGNSGQLTQTPVMEDIALPVDMRPAKASLKPIYDELSTRLTPAQRQYSPSLQAIKNILDDKDFVPASAADDNLSALKAIQRENGPSPKAKFLVARTIDAVSPAVDKAVAQAGPDAVKALQDGRAAWADKYKAIDLIKDIGGSAKGDSGQVAIADHLTTPRDARFPDLKRVLDVAPDAKEDIGKYAMAKVFGKSLENDGQYTSPATAANNWNRLGDKTKAALFEPEHIKDIDSFMELSKRLAENPNSSGSGLISALKDAGIGIMTANPKTGAAFGVGRQLAKVLYNPEGATALNQFLKAAPGSQERSIAGSIVRSVAEEAAGKIATPDDGVIRATISKP